MSDKNETLLIESYREQTESWRQEASLLHRFTSVILPLSIAVLGAPYVQNGGANEMIALLAPMGGIILMTFWGISCQIMETKSKIRHSIIYNLEDRFRTVDRERFRGQAEFRRIRSKAGGKKLSSHRLRVFMFWIYFCVAIVMLLPHIIDFLCVNPKYILAWVAILLFGISFVLSLWITLKAKSVREQVDRLEV